MPWKTLDDMDLAGKVVLVRVDINVPMEAGRVTDMTRIDKIRPTVDDIVAKGGKVVLLAHFDRPKGKVVPEMSLSHVVDAVAGSLGRKVVFGSDCVGERGGGRRLPRRGRRMWCCWKTPASIRARKRTIPSLRRRWPPWAMSM
jgi:3-phosphoglycerate kinase